MELDYSNYQIRCGFSIQDWDEKSEKAVDPFSFVDVKIMMYLDSDLETGVTIDWTGAMMTPLESRGSWIYSKAIVSVNCY